MMGKMLGSMFLHFAVLVLLTGEMVIGSIPRLNCASCAYIACPPEPVCELDRIPCGCCNVCTLGSGDTCEGFTASCGFNLQCLTPGGIYDERPPWFSPLKGICVPMYLTPPPIRLTPTIAWIGRKR